MPKAGAIWIDILPSMAGFNTAVRTQAAISLEGAGAKAGQGFTAGLKRMLKGGAGFAEVGAQAEAAAKRAAEAVKSAEVKVSAAHKRAADAAGAERVAELKLQEMRDKGKASAAQLAGAEERVAKAHRTTEAAAGAERRAQAQLVSAQHASTKASEESAAAARTSSGKFSTAAGTVGRSADKMGGKVKGFLKTAGGMAGLFAGFEVAKFAGESVKAATEYQKSTSVLVTAAGETKSNLAIIRKGIVSISNDTGTTTDQLSEGMYTIEKAGIRGAAGLKVLDAASKGAKEENADLGTVTNAMTSIMNSYGIKAGKSVKVMNELKTAAAQSKTSMQNFAGSLSTVLPIAAANKISFADVAGAIGTLTSHGTSAQEATQELAFSIRSLSAPNAVAVKEMGQFGIKSQDVAKNLGKKGLQGTITELSEAVLKHMGPSGKVLLSTFYKSTSAAKSAQQMYDKLTPAQKKLADAFKNGSESYKDWTKDAKGSLAPEQYNQINQWATLQKKATGFNDAIKQGLPGSQSYSEAMKKMMGGATGLNTALMLTGTSADATKKRTDAIAESYKDNAKEVEGWSATQKTAAVAQDRMKNAISNAGMVMATAFLPTLTKLTTKLADGITSVMAWSQKQNWSWVGPTAKAFGVLLAAMLAFKAVKKVVNGVTNTFKALKTGVNGVKTAVKGVGKGIRAGVSGGQKAVTALKSGFDTMRLRAMYAKDAVNKGWSKGVSGLKSMGNAVKSAGSSMLTMSKNAAKATANMVKTGAVAAANGIKFVALKVASLAVAAAQKAWAAAQWLLNAAMDANPITLIVIGLAALAAGLVIAYKKSKTFRDIVNGAWSAVKNTALAVVNWFKTDFVGFFTKTIPHAFQTCVDWVKSHWKLILGIITGPIGAATIFIATHWDTIKGYFSGAWSWVKGTFKSAWNGTKDIVSKPIDLAKAAINTAIGGVKSAFRGIWSFISTTFKRDWDGIQDLFTHPIQSAKKIISTILGATGLRKVFSDAVDAIGRVWSKIEDKFQAPLDFVKKIINRFIGAFNAVGKLVGFKLPKLAVGGSVAAVGHGGGRALPAYAGGGPIHGPWRGPKADNVLGVSSAGVPVARVNPGEFITNVAATRSMQRNHPGALEHINATGSLPGLAGGGLAGIVKTVAYALKQVGKRYVFGAAGPDAFDCSGLTSQAWLHGAGVRIPHLAAAQHNIGYSVSRGNLFPGDLVFPRVTAGGGIPHVEMYVGDGQVVEAMNPSLGIRGPHAMNGFAGGARRPIYMTANANASNRSSVMSALGDAILAAAKKGGGLLGSLGGAVFNHLKGWMTGPLKAMNKFAGPLSRTVLPGLAKGLASHAVSTGIDKMKSLFSFSGGGGGSTAAGSPRQMVPEIASRFGVANQTAAIDWIFNRESGFNVHATNPLSGAYGIPQALPGYKMSSMGPDWHDSAATQIAWGVKYMIDRYGSPNAAMAFWKRNHYYLNGTSSAAAGPAWLSEDGRPELVIGRQQRMMRGGERVYNADATSKILASSGTAIDPAALERALERAIAKGMDGARIDFDANGVAHLVIDQMGMMADTGVVH